MLINSPLPTVTIPESRIGHDDRRPVDPTGRSCRPAGRSRSVGTCHVRVTRRPCGPLRRSPSVHAVPVPSFVPGLPGLPPDLAGPVAVELSKPVRAIPEPGALPGGCRYEPKWDGYRLVIVRSAAGTRLWSKQGRDLTDRFPDVVAAARAQVPAGTVVDGEVVVWSGERLDFALLQQRMVTGIGKILALASRHPASYVAFDVLARGGKDLRRSPLVRRRAELEEMGSGWKPPLQLSPVTDDPDEAA